MKTCFCGADDEDRDKARCLVQATKEIEVEVLRIAMLRENWQCLAEDESPSCVADTSEILPELSAAPRPAPAQMAGPWKVFDVSCGPRTR